MRVAAISEASRVHAGRAYAAGERGGQRAVFHMVICRDCIAAVEGGVRGDVGGHDDDVGVRGVVFGVYQSDNALARAATALV